MLRFGVGIWGLAVGGWWLAVGGWRLGFGGWGLGVGGWGLGFRVWGLGFGVWGLPSKRIEKPAGEHPVVEHWVDPAAVHLGQKQKP